MFRPGFIGAGWRTLCDHPHPDPLPSRERGCTSLRSPCAPFVLRTFPPRAGATLLPRRFFCALRHFSAARGHPLRVASLPASCLWVLGLREGDVCTSVEIALCPLCPSDISPASGGNPAAPTVFFAHCGTSPRRAVTPCGHPLRVASLPASCLWVLGLREGDVSRFPNASRRGRLHIRDGLAVNEEILVQLPLPLPSGFPRSRD